MKAELAPRRASLEGEPDFYGVLRPLASTYAARRSVERIAVVGNQPLEASATRAEVIDSADLVFRVNGFRLDEPDEAPAVGTKADVVVFNRGVRPTPWFFSGYRERLYLLIEPGRMQWEWEVYPHFWPRDLGFVTVPNRDVIIPLGREIGLDPEHDGEWATTGTTMMWIAAHLFPNAALDVAGLSFVDDPEQTSWEHAYGDACPVGPEHRIANEGRLARRWIDSGRIRFHR
ncbi:hypothetical protein GCM10025760_28040 [Microbacterium yannicii]|uniref:Glycosyltransferase family 29 (Sialyltransferase) n=1 Tax=Microbacterium yannicii TaxID=671622 RepID=A0ABP9MJP7_9MICO|nr:glycosyltransferase family 29 protein [Microbacterium yannicii]MCO5953412.1 glycosyltransferase family 29 protein [Microbacterium yannicii]